MPNICEKHMWGTQFTNCLRNLGPHIHFRTPFLRNFNIVYYFIYWPTWKVSIELFLSGASVGLVVISGGLAVFSGGLVAMSGLSVVFSGRSFCFKRLP